MKKFVNWALLVQPETLYPVSYTVDQRGNRYPGLAFLRGSDLSENQIKELRIQGIV